MKILKLKFVLKDWNCEDFIFSEKEMKQFCDYIDDCDPNLLDYISCPTIDSTNEYIQNNLGDYTQSLHENYQYKVYTEYESTNEIKLLELLVLLDESETIQDFNLNKAISKLINSISLYINDIENIDDWMKTVAKFLERLIDFELIIV